MVSPKEVEYIPLYVDLDVPEEYLEEPIKDDENRGILIIEIL
jgi:hypothetical protein